MLICVRWFQASEKVMLAGGKVAGKIKNVLPAKQEEKEDKVEEGDVVGAVGAAVKKTLRKAGGAPIEVLRVQLQTAEQVRIPSFLRPHSLCRAALTLSMCLRLRPERVPAQPKEPRDASQAPGSAPEGEDERPTSAGCGARC